MSDFYRDCEACDATGRTGNILSPGQGVCKACEGKTMILTDLGRSLLDFLTRAKRDQNLARG